MLDADGFVSVTPVPVPRRWRQKRWDVDWEYDGKYRLGLSLKSLLKNRAPTQSSLRRSNERELYDSSQPAPEAVVYISAASDDQNKDDQFAVVNGVADTLILALRGGEPLTRAPVATYASILL